MDTPGVHGSIKHRFQERGDVSTVQIYNIAIINVATGPSCDKWPLNNLSTQIVMALKRKMMASSKASKHPKTSSPSVNSPTAALSHDGSEHWLREGQQ